MQAGSLQQGMGTKRVVAAAMESAMARLRYVVLIKERERPNHVLFTPFFFMIGFIAVFSFCFGTLSKYACRNCHKLTLNLG